MAATTTRKPVSKKLLNAKEKVKTLRSLLRAAKDHVRTVRARLKAARAAVKMIKHPIEVEILIPEVSAAE